MDNEDYDSTHDKLDRIEEKLENLESEVSYIKENMLTLGKLAFWFILIVAFALWGDKIWEFVKGAFFLVIGLGYAAFLKLKEVCPEASEHPFQLVFGAIILIWGIGVAIEGHKKKKKEKANKKDL